MSEVRISGASDDLIEIGGDIIEEFSPADTDEFFIVASDGTALSGVYDGTWRFTLHTRGSAEMEKREAPADDDDDYSDVITLRGDIAWVALASNIAK